MKRLVYFLFCLLSFANTYAVDYKYHFMLTGASFGVAENGWFELSCKAFDAEAINKAVSGEAIYHTANRMATNTFYTKDQLERTDVFVIMHVHNQNVADQTWLKTDFNEYTMPTSNYAIAYDYVIKKYKDDCYKLKDDPTSKYYGTPNGKPATIVLCTHWHDARTVYNPAIRLLAQKWNLPLVEWDTNIGFTKDVLVNGQQPSIQYAMNNEVINGVTYGWHPLTGQGQYIQKKMSDIFNATMQNVVGVIPVSANVSAKSGLVLSGETTVVNVSFTGLSPWNLSYKVNDETIQLTGITSNPLKLDFTIPEGENLVVEPISVSNNSVENGTVSGEATISYAAKLVNPVYGAYVHQANPTTSYTNDQYVQIKTTADNYSREAFFTFNLNDISANDEKIIFRAYFYQRVYPNNGNVLEDHRVEIAGNTESYSTLTWNTKPANMTKIGETLIYPSDMGGYVSWDITSWAKEMLAAGKTKITLKLKVSSGGGLLYFYSSEASENKPQLIIGNALGTDVKEISEDRIKIINTQAKISITSDEAIRCVVVSDVNGKSVYKRNNCDVNAMLIDTFLFPKGLYIINVYSVNNSFSQKLLKQ